MATPEQRIRDFYGFDFPEDFFRFREFLAELPKGPAEEFASLRPSHPFAVADGSPARDHAENPHWEDRYYFDLPEFITIFTDSSTAGLHWGYFFDDPGRIKPIVAAYWHGDTFQHEISGDDIFRAVRLQIELEEQEFERILVEDPDDIDFARKKLGKLQAIREKLAKYWGGDRTQVGARYERQYGWKTRRKPVTDTFSDVGIVVPRKQYRQLSSDPIARQRRSGGVELEQQEVESLMAEATELLKSGHPGAALKLGHYLWVWAREHPAVYDLLDAAYDALDRQPLRQRLKIAKEYRTWCEGTWK